MKIIVAKKFANKNSSEDNKLDEYIVEFDWHDNDEISIQTLYNNERLSVSQQKAETLDLSLRSFNAGWGGNNRETFKALLRCNKKAEISSIARVIGITNGLCHYFANYILNERNIGFLLSSMREARGFVFVDWDTVSVGGRNSNNQLIYLLTDDQECQYANDLRLMYKLGYTGIISIEDNNHLLIKCNYLESKDLNNPQAKQFGCVESIIKKINDILSKKLGE